MVYRPSIRQFILVLVFLSVFLGLQQPAQAQIKARADSSKFLKIMRSSEHSAGKAAIYSAIIPGWGQAYNRKYWKIPIVYAGLATVGYFVVDNQINYSLCRDDYITVYWALPRTLKNTNGYSTKSELLSAIDAYRKNRDLFVIVSAAVWLLNVVDANVDGHFYNYDISDDLSLNIFPAGWRMPDGNDYLGLNLVIALH